MKMILPAKQNCNAHVHYHNKHEQNNVLKKNPTITRRERERDSVCLCLCVRVCAHARMQLCVYVHVSCMCVYALPHVQNIIVTSNFCKNSYSIRHLALIPIKITSTLFLNFFSSENDPKPHCNFNYNRKVQRLRVNH